jgi:hypothetical protein
MTIEYWQVPSTNIRALSFLALPALAASKPELAGELMVTGLVRVLAPVQYELIILAESFEKIF